MAAPSNNTFTVSNIWNQPPGDQPITAVPGFGAHVVHQGMPEAEIQTRLNQYVGQLVQAGRVIEASKIGLPMNGSGGAVYQSKDRGRFYCKGTDAVRIMGADHINRCGQGTCVKAPLKILVVPDGATTITFHVTHYLTVRNALIYAPEIKPEGRCQQHEIDQLNAVIERSRFADPFPSNFIRNNEGLFIIDTESFWNGFPKPKPVEPPPPTPEEIAERQKQEAREKKREEIAKLSGDARTFHTLHANLQEALEDRRWGEAGQAIAGLAGIPKHGLFTKLEYILQEGLQKENPDEQRAILNRAMMLLRLMEQNNISRSTPLAKLTEYLVYIHCGNEESALDAYAELSNPYFNLRALEQNYRDFGNETMVNFVHYGVLYSIIHQTKKLLPEMLEEGKLDEVEATLARMQSPFSEYAKMIHRYKSFDELREEVSFIKTIATHSVATIQELIDEGKKEAAAAEIAKLEQETERPSRWLQHSGQLERLKSACV